LLLSGLLGVALVGLVGGVTVPCAWPVLGSRTMWASPLPGVWIAGRYGDCVRVCVVVMGRVWSARLLVRATAPAAMAMTTPEAATIVGSVGALRFRVDIACSLVVCGWFVRARWEDCERWWFRRDWSPVKGGVV